MGTDPVRSIRLKVSDKISVTTKVDAPKRMTPKTPGLLLAHGTSNDLDHPLLAYAATRLAQEDAALVLRFNFPYAERGAASPDAHSVLEETYRRAHDLLTDEFLPPGGPVILGGKSRGGWIAAELVSRGPEAEGLPAAGLLILGYPLHIPDYKEQLNTEPLRRISVPSLVCSGSRDPFCDTDLLRPILAGLTYPGCLYVVEGGDHSLILPKSSGRDPEDAYEAVATQIVAFVRSVGDSGNGSGGGSDA